MLKLASAIGWIDFTGVTVSQATPTTIISLTVGGGVSLTFSLSATGTGSLSGTAIPTWSGAAMGNLGYTGIGGRCALYGAGVNVNARIQNITFKDRYGDTIPDFSFYFTDAEATLSTSGEQLRFSSDQAIYQVDHYPTNLPCPAYVGEGTQFITMSGFACSGGSIPTGVTLGSTIPLNTGDFLVVTIKNTPIAPFINPVKSVDITSGFQGDTITYTIAINSVGNLTGNNVKFIDTIPVGTTFITNSVQLDGVGTTENPQTGIALGNITGTGIHTITFKVVVN
ncbi:MAG: DUF11 domain-containing protein [Clostridium sp.]|uniref:DUF11 domain-containing protein n=1 Tax=Clostridium sp. TaxID=1506 RepID=UPI003F33266C